jgi:murein L,D-transpeptidase YcbB/YkuD
LFLALGLLLLWPAAAVQAAEGSVSPQVSTDSQTETVIGQRLAGQGPLIIDGISLDRARLALAYAARQGQPIWAGHPTWPAELEAALGASGRQGIPPESLGLPALQRALADPRLSSTDRDLLLTDRFLAYGAMLARGRVDLTTVEDSWAIAAPLFDPAAAITGLENAGPAAALGRLAPDSSDYVQLQDALARYQSIASAGGWVSLPSATSLSLGEQSPAVVLLRQRLAAEGYLPADATEDPKFDGALEAAVKDFQTNHDLLVDGRVGAGTIAALDVTAADRVLQIRVNLERLRGMPHFLPPTRIEVQEAKQMLTLYRDGKPALVSRVITGLPIHATPVLEAYVESIVLNPTWDVPVSIIRNEILPKVDQDPDYLARNHYVGSGYQIRQLPGPWNALGTVMLNMPNDFSVYLHDTPFHNLFALPQRALSHGCVRVDAVRELAAALLGEPLPAPGGPTHAILLDDQMPVYFLYQTAFGTPDGTVAFYNDIYGRDAPIAAAMSTIEHGAAMPMVSATPQAKPKVVAVDNTLSP